MLAALYALAWLAVVCIPAGASLWLATHWPRCALHCPHRAWWFRRSDIGAREPVWFCWLHYRATRRLSRSARVPRTGDLN